MLETRGSRRRRQCGNLHRFPTTERVEVSLKDRNQQMVKAVLSGRTISDVARQFGLKSHSELSRIMKKVAPDRNNRSMGQLTRRRGAPRGRSRED